VNTDPGIDFAPRLAAMIRADEPPATLAEQTLAVIHEHRSGASAQDLLLGEAAVALENGGYDEAATRLGDIRIAFALGRGHRAKLLTARLPGAPFFPPAGER
jgi:hypothetical protein